MSLGYGQVFHVGAWLLWLAATMIAALTTRNPFYLLCVLLVAWVVGARLERRAAMTPGGPSDAGGEQAPTYTSTALRSRRLLLRTVVTLTVLVTLLKGLSLHLGATVLFRLPDEWPVIGGPITLESLVWSSVDALSILTLLAVFAAFSAGADYYALLRSLPSFLHQVGLVTSIAITFVPQTVARFSEIRDAAALRGHRIRRVGDLLPLIIPLLAGGMDRSMNLAEAMEARGFSKYNVTTRKVSPIVVQCGLIAATMLLIGGGALLAFGGKMPVAGWAMLAAGAITLVLTLRAEGRGSGRTRLRRAVWREQDTVLASLCLGAIGFLVAYWGIASPSIYYPFPDLYVPPFDPVVAAVLWSLTAPAVLPPRLARPVRMRP